MLTEHEKNILGAMVDMGHLQGQKRIEVAGDDDLAREAIADFTAQQTQFLPMQISALTRNKESMEAELSKLQKLSDLLQ